MLPKETFAPEIGGLYQFRTDNKEFLYSKYGYYYSGLAMCIKADIMNDMRYYSGNDIDEEIYYLNNPLYCFEVYSCLQNYNPKFGSLTPRYLIDIPLYLTLRESNDMLSPLD